MGNEDAGGSGGVDLGAARHTANHVLAVAAKFGDGTDSFGGTLTELARYVEAMAAELERFRADVDFAKQSAGVTAAGVGASYAVGRLVGERDTLADENTRLKARVAELESGYDRESDDVCQMLGKALGFPWFKDDPVNFPGSTESHGVCVGEHVPGSLAAVAARRIAELDSLADVLSTRLADASEALSRAAARTADRVLGLIDGSDVGPSGVVAWEWACREVARLLGERGDRPGGGGQTT